METLINILVIGVIAWLSIAFGFLFAALLAFILTAFDFVNRHDLLGKFLTYFIVVPSVPITIVVSFLYMYFWWFD